MHKIDPINNICLWMRERYTLKTSPLKRNPRLHWTCSPPRSSWCYLQGHKKDRWVWSKGSGLNPGKERKVRETQREEVWPTRQRGRLCLNSSFIRWTVLKSGEAASCRVCLSKFNDPQTQNHNVCRYSQARTQAQRTVPGHRWRESSCAVKCTEEENKVAAARSEWEERASSELEVAGPNLRNGKSHSHLKIPTTWIWQVQRTFKQFTLKTVKWCQIQNQGFFFSVSELESRSLGRRSTRNPNEVIITCKLIHYCETSSDCWGVGGGMVLTHVRQPLVKSCHIPPTPSWRLVKANGKEAEGLKLKLHQSRVWASVGVFFLIKHTLGPPAGGCGSLEWVGGAGIPTPSAVCNNMGSHSSAHRQLSSPLPHIRRWGLVRGRAGIGWG